MHEQTLQFLTFLEKKNKWLKVPSTLSMNKKMAFKSSKGIPDGDFLMAIQDDIDSFTNSERLIHPKNAKLVILQNEENNKQMISDRTESKLQTVLEVGTSVMIPEYTQKDKMGSRVNILQASQSLEKKTENSGSQNWEINRIFNIEFFNLKEFRTFSEKNGLENSRKGMQFLWRNYQSKIKSLNEEIGFLESKISKIKSKIDKNELQQNGNKSSLKESVQTVYNSGPRSMKESLLKFCATNNKIVTKINDSYDAFEIKLLQRATELKNSQKKGTTGDSLFDPTNHQNKAFKNLIEFQWTKNHRDKIQSLETFKNQFEAKFEKAIAFAHLKGIKIEEN